MGCIEMAENGIMQDKEQPAKNIEQATIEMGSRLLRIIAINEVTNAPPDPVIMSRLSRVGPADE